MATVYTGLASARPQIDSVTVSGAIVAGNTGSVVIGYSTLTVTAQSGTTTTSSFAQALERAINAKGIRDNTVANEGRNAAGQQLPEFQDVEAYIDPLNTSRVLVRSKVPGVPFYDAADSSDPKTLSVSSTGGGALTLASASVQTATGPSDWNASDNWIGGLGVPANGDSITLGNSSYSIKYNLPTNLELRTGVFRHYMSFSGMLGLPAINRDNPIPYAEYRPRYPVFYDYDGILTGTPRFDLGLGGGPGSPMLNIEYDARIAGAVATFRVFNTARPNSQISQHAVNIATDSTTDTNTLEVLGGSVAVGVAADNKVGSFDTIKVGHSGTSRSDVTLLLDQHLSPTGLTMIQNGGTITYLGSGSPIIDLVEINSGNLIWNNPGSVVTALNIYKGRFSPVTGATFTTVVIGREGVLDANLGNENLTITNLDMYAGASFIDDADRTTVTNGPDLVHCGLEDVVLRRGKHLRVTKGAVS